MNPKYGALIILLTFGLSIGIYSTTYNEFSISSVSNGVVTQTNTCASITGNNNTLCISLNNSGVSNVGSSSPIGNSNTNSTSCVIDPETGVCVNIENLYNALENLGCEIQKIFGFCQSSASNSLNIAKGSTISVNNYAANSNSILNVLSNPLNQALIALSAFLALGILAGTFGAGILARVMVLAGMALSIVVYVEGQIGIFSGMPDLIYGIVNGFIAILMIIVIWGAFDSGGIG